MAWRRGGGEGDGGDGGGGDGGGEGGGGEGGAWRWHPLLLLHRLDLERVEQSRCDDGDLDHAGAAAAEAEAPLVWMCSGSR